MNVLCLQPIPDQIKLRMLELSIRRSESNFITGFFFLASKKKTVIVIFR